MEVKEIEPKTKRKNERRGGDARERKNKERQQKREKRGDWRKE